MNGFRKKVHKGLAIGIPRLNLELWKIGEGQKNLREAVRQILEQNFEHVQLLGIAGALNSELHIGDIISQNSEAVNFALVERPILNAKDRNDLARSSQKSAVVMESFWSDPNLNKRLAPECFFETRVISDHCENLDLQAIRKNLSGWMDAVVTRALPKLR